MFKKGFVWSLTDLFGKDPLCCVPIVSTWSMVWGKSTPESWVVSMLWPTSALTEPNFTEFLFVAWNISINSQLLKSFIFTFSSCCWSQSAAPVKYWGSLASSTASDSSRCSSTPTYPGAGAGAGAGAGSPPRSACPRSPWPSAGRRGCPARSTRVRARRNTGARRWGERGQLIIVHF